jgi:hypothetical protein
MLPSQFLKLALGISLSFCSSRRENIGASTLETPIKRVNELPTTSVDKGCPRASLENFDALKAMITEENITSVDGFLACVPQEYRAHYTLVYESHSPEKKEVTPTTPRVISFGDSAKFVFAFTGVKGGQFSSKLQLIDYSSDPRGESAHYELNFKDDASLSASLNNKNPNSCLFCHANSRNVFKPLWRDYPQWPGVYGSRGDVFLPNSLKDELVLPTNTPIPSQMLFENAYHNSTLQKNEEEMLLLPKDKRTGLSNHQIYKKLKNLKDLELLPEDNKKGLNNYEIIKKLNNLKYETPAIKGNQAVIEESAAYEKYLLDKPNSIYRHLTELPSYLYYSKFRFNQADYDEVLRQEKKDFDDSEDMRRINVDAGDPEFEPETYAPTVRLYRPIKNLTDEIPFDQSPNLTFTNLIVARYFDAIIAKISNDQKKALLHYLIQNLCGKTITEYSSLIDLTHDFLNTNSIFNLIDLNLAFKSDLSPQFYEMPFVLYFGEKSALTYFENQFLNRLFIHSTETNKPAFFKERIPPGSRIDDIRRRREIIDRNKEFFCPHLQSAHDNL